MAEHEAAIAFGGLPSHDDRGAPMRVTMLTRAQCHLCRRAATIIDDVCGRTGAAWAQADIDDHPALLPAYGDWVPVVFVDGRQHDYWQVDPVRLTEALTSR